MIDNVKLFIQPKIQFGYTLGDVSLKQVDEAEGKKLIESVDLAMIE
ncbi:hypothetical protein [Methylotenera sp. N17]|nr:hypothetical protein [Methylotenera sp. N17]